MTFATTLATRTRRSAIWSSRGASIGIATRIKLPASSTRAKPRPRASSRGRPRWAARVSSTPRTRPVTVPRKARAKTRNRRKRRRPAENYNVAHNNKKITVFILSRIEVCIGPSAKFRVFVMPCIIA